ncbi:MAG: PQQ-binding-like beta-propeller repeat protein [Halorientalis sp.]
MPSRRQFLAGASAAALAGTAGCLGSDAPRYAGGDDPRTDWWPQATFDVHGTCYNPRAVGPTGGVTERWSLETSGPSARPVVADGRAYLPTASAVLAVDAASGDVLWREDGGDPPLWPREVCVHGDTVYVAAVEEPAVVALDAASGRRRWTFSPREGEFGVRSLLVQPREHSPVLYAGGDGAVYALDPATGRTDWRREVFGTVAHLALGLPSLVAVTETGEVYALSVDDGTGQWRRNLNARTTALAAPYGSGPVVSSFGGPTTALDRSAGATRWQRDGWSADSLVVTADTLFTAGSQLTARGTGDGRARWTGGATTQCGPAGAGRTVYAASEDAVTAYEFGGGVGLGGLRFDATRWSHDVEGRPEQGLAVADGAVFVLTEGSGEGERSMAYALA